MGKVKVFALVALGALGGASYVAYKAIDYIVTDESAKKAFKTYVSDKIDKTAYQKSRKSKYSYTREKHVYTFVNAVFDTRSDAESVLERMNELVDEYGVVTVADMYDLVSIEVEFVDYRYGWTNIHDAKIVRIRDGYIIKLPIPTQLD